MRDVGVSQAGRSRPSLPKRIAFDIKELSTIILMSEAFNKPLFTTDNATSLCYFEDISNLSSR